MKLLACQEHVYLQKLRNAVLLKNVHVEYNIVAYILHLLHMMYKCNKCNYLTEFLLFTRVHTY